MDQSAPRNVEADQSNTISKSADLVKFNFERTWTKWELKLEKFLSITPRVNNLPLSYVVWFQTDPDRTTDLQGNLIAETIACAPLSGAHFQSDERKVHQLLKKYPVVETAEQWISSIEKHANSQDDFDALCRHYSGEVNVSRHVTIADRLREKLHYKSKRVMSFNTFLYRMHKIFNIFHYER